VSRSGHPWVTRGAALAVVVVWSTCFVAIKGLVGTVPPLLAAALRALLAASVLMALARLEGALRPPRAAWPWLVLLGLFNTTLGLAGMFLSVGLAGAALPAVLANSQALLVAPAAVWLFREPLPARAVAGLVVGVGGIAWLFVASAGSSWWSAAGALLGLASALGLAAGNLLMKRLSRQVPALSAVAWQFLIGGVGLLAWSLAAEGPPAIAPTPRLLASLVYLGVVGSAVASWAWYRLLARDTLVGLNGLTLLVPVLAVVWARLLFGEVVEAPALAGLALAVIGVALVSLPGAAAPRPATRGVAPRGSPGWASPPRDHGDPGEDARR